MVSILVATGAAFADYGFDSYGEYFWTDSDETFGPAYSWIDASGGTDLGTGDKYAWTVQLPFDVMFYGKLFPAGSDFRVTTNTDCGFEYAGMGIYNNTDLSSPAEHTGIICLFWDVLYDPYGDHLYVCETTYGAENAWVISYDPRGRYVRPGEGRLQTIILETDGTHDSTIIHQFEEAVFGSGVVDYGASTTAGIENAGATEDNSGYCSNEGSVEGVVVWYVDSDLLHPSAFNPAGP